MRVGRISKAIALAAAAVLAMGACTATPPNPVDSTPAPTAAVGGNVTVLEGKAFTDRKSVV